MKIKINNFKSSNRRSRSQFYEHNVNKLEKCIKNKATGVPKVF